MAPRSFLFCILCTIGLIPSLITALNVSLGFAREPPRTLVTAKGRTVVIPCVPSQSSSSSTDPARVVSWTLDGVPLKLLNSDAAADGATSAQDTRRTLMPDGSLFIKKVLHRSSTSASAATPSSSNVGDIAISTASDQGVYQCTIANNVGAILSRSSRLRVATLASSFSENPEDVSVELGNAARFSCHIDAVPEATITWEKDRETLPQDERYQVLPSGVLLIGNIKEKDSGNYRCIASSPNLNRKRQSSEGKLNILSASKEYKPPQLLAPQISIINNNNNNYPSSTSPTPTGEPNTNNNNNNKPPIQNIEVLQGETLSLECAASGYPTPQLVWSVIFPGQTQQTVVSSMLYGVNVLHLPNIESSYSGLYTCAAVNHQTEDSPPVFVKQVYNVTVLVPPFFIKEPQSQTFPTAKTVRFECELGGIPTPQVSWYKNGVQLHINGRIKLRGSSLVLSNTVTDDSGIYQCRGTSVAGEVWEAARLLVNTSRNQPNPPTGIKCNAISPNAISLTWDGSTTGFMAYTVHYLPTEGGEERQEVAVNRTYRIEKLHPFTNYTFYVRVYSGQSASDQSARVVCRTGEGVPYIAPQVKLQVLGPTSLKASWDLLSPEEALGQVTEHKIQWRKSGQKSANVDEVKADVLDYTITGLTPGQEYDVRVLSATSQGWPELSDDQNSRGFNWFSVQMSGLGPTNSNVPLPPEVQLTVVNATSIQVTWTLPRENKVKPSGFRLSYRRQNDMLVGPIELDGHIHQYLLTGLDAQTQYEIQVQAVGTGDIGGGTGAKSIHTLTEGAEHRTEDALVEPPTSLEAEPSSPTSVRLKWQAPSTAADSVSYYTVRYHPVQSALSVNASTLSYVRSTSLSVEVTDLRPFTVYEFQVRSHDANSNQGPYSNKVECQTMEDVPGPPWSLQWKILNLTTVRVSWKEPLQANGLLGPYRLYYTLDASKPLDQWTQIETILSHTEVTGLKANDRYYLCVRGSTFAGLGQTTSVVTITIPAVVPVSPGPSIPTAPNPPSSTYENRMWLIFIALGTGLLAILALVALVLTMRYAKTAQQPDSSQCSGEAARNRRLHHSNGNGFFRSTPHSSSIQQTNVDQGHNEEMEFFAPIAFTGSSTNIPPAETSTTHLDTKGGYPVHLNGTRAPLLGNGRVPNGHVTKPYHTRPDIQLRITENPQFNSHSDVNRIECPSCSSTGIDVHGGVCKDCNHQTFIRSGEETLLLNSSNHQHQNNHHNHHNNHHLNHEEENERWRSGEGDETQLTNLPEDDSLLEELDELERRRTHKNGQPPCA